MAGIYGFKMKPLEELIQKLESNNAQNELYLTDLIEMFVNNNLSISTYMPKDSRVVLGFNDKTVLKEMESIARSNVYNKLKNIITIYDGEDFFIDDTVVEQILHLVLYYFLIVSYHLLMLALFLAVLLSCLENQRLILDGNVKIYSGNQIKGNVYIGKNTTLERGVNVTGSDNHPVNIGSNVLIKGVSYLYGSIVDDNAYIEHCIFYYSHIKALLDEKGNVIKCRFIRPKEEGVESVSKIEDGKKSKKK